MSEVSLLDIDFCLALEKQRHGRVLLPSSHLFMTLQDKLAKLGCEITNDRTAVMSAKTVKRNKKKMGWCNNGNVLLH